MSLQDSGKSTILLSLYLSHRHLGVLAVSGGLVSRSNLRFTSQPPIHPLPLTPPILPSSSAYFQATHPSSHYINTHDWVFGERLDRGSNISPRALLSGQGPGERAREAMRNAVQSQQGVMLLGENACQIPDRRVEYS